MATIKYKDENGQWQEIAIGGGGSTIEVDAELNADSENPVQNKVIYEALQNVSVPVDAELSDTSENPVQNKVLTAKINEIDSKIKPQVPFIYYTNGTELTDEEKQTNIDSINKVLAGEAELVTTDYNVNKIVKAELYDLGYEGMGIIAFYNDITRKGIIGLIMCSNIEEYIFEYVNLLETYDIIDSTADRTSSFLEFITALEFIGQVSTIIPVQFPSCRIVLTNNGKIGYYVNANYYLGIVWYWSTIQGDTITFLIYDSEEEVVVKENHSISKPKPFCVETTYADLVTLRDNNGLVPGQKYRIIDYETTTSKEGSQSAGHPFDIIVTALDNHTLDEKASAIQSERDTDGYFANSNLEAWDVRYCLDNDIDRFDWAVKAGKYLTVDVVESTIRAVPNGTFEYESTTYYRWDAYLSGMLVYLLTTNDSPAVGETASLYIPEYSEIISGGSVVSFIELTDNGFGVVYRLIDDKRNDVPYDFKNIQFVRKITDGALDLENGADTYCYTFSDFSTGVLLDASESLQINRCNKFGVFCWDNVFLGSDCYLNTFGNGCLANTFGGNCYSNIFGDYCNSNIFGSSCHSNTFANSCNSNVFVYNCYSNTFGSACKHNTFGSSCQHNTFGSYCSSNTFGTAESPLASICYYKVDFVSNTEIAATASLEYVTYVTKNSSGEIKQFCIADLIQ